LSICSEVLSVTNVHSALPSWASLVSSCASTWPWDALIHLELDPAGVDARRYDLRPAAAQQLLVFRAHTDADRGARVHLVQCGADDAHRQVGDVFNLVLDDPLGDLEGQIDDLALGGAIESGVLLADVVDQSSELLDLRGHGRLGGG
jgi:hypothetical protein